VDTYRQAEARPLDSSKEIVKLQGRKNLCGAFHGDIVEVEIFEDFDDDIDGQYGRVKRMAMKGSVSVFLCRMDARFPNCFLPLDKKYPIFTAMHPFDSTKVYVVSFKRWVGDYYPHGTVIQEFPRTYTLKESEVLLKYVHSVEYSTDEGPATGNADTARRDSSLKLHDRVFTIDPEGTKNLDDAISIVPGSTSKHGHKVYQLGVHIVNAAKHIQPGTGIDNSAKERGTSVYTGEKGVLMHMLSDPKLRYKLSLIPGAVRDVLSVTCSVTLVGSRYEFGECSISPAQVKSVIQLTYKEAQCLLDGVIPLCCNEAERILSLLKSTKLLYRIAVALRRRRLMSNAVSREVDDLDEANCWQSHLLVEELMIWANNEVAERIHSCYPNAALLNRQPPPKDSSREAVVEENKSIMSASISLSQHLPNHKVSLPSACIKIPLESLKLIRKALEESNTAFLAYLLSEDRLYPQFAYVASKFRSISRRAEYYCTEESQASVAHAYRHHSLCLDKYTHFSSPIRRYIDIEVQRMLLEGMKAEADRRTFSYQEHMELCSRLNMKRRSASDFEKKMKNVRLASECAVSSKISDAFISEVKKGSMEVTFPDLELKHFPSRDNALKITNFSYFSRNNENYMWRLHITTLRNDLAESLLKLPNMTLSPATGADSVSSEWGTGKASSTASPHVKPSQGSKEKHKALSTQQPSVSCAESTITAYYNCSSDDTSLDSKCFLVSLPASYIEVPPTSWRKALEFVKDPTTERMDELCKLLPRDPPHSLHSKSPSSSSLKYTFLECDVRALLNESSILKVWVTGIPGTTREPVISPAIQLVEVSPLLRICVQHNSHPAECFSDPNLSQASRRVYESLTEYVELWTKVLVAEAAEQSVRDYQPLICIIRDVTVTWPSFEKCSEHCYVPTGSIALVLPKHFVEDCSSFFTISVGDLICLRYDCHPENLRAVYHVVVVGANSDRQEHTITIYMKVVGEKSCQVFEGMKRVLESGKQTCEMQRISLGPSYR
jgi:exoribonuclease R